MSEMSATIQKGELQRSRHSGCFHKATSHHLKYPIDWDWPNGKTLKSVLRNTLRDPGAVKPCKVCFKAELANKLTTNSKPTADAESGK